VGYVPVENITFPSLEKMKDGEYVCMIHNWQWRAPTEAGFKAEIEFAGQVFEYEHTAPLSNKQWVKVATVTLKHGAFSIEHHLPCSTSSQKVWGIDTETFVPVQTVMFSPNHWDEQAIGNKHWFFILEGCKTDEPLRGIYNEYLRADLQDYRKVFEVLGSKTKCPVTAEQLSGVGFSSTQNQSVLVQVVTDRGQRLYDLQF